MLLLACLVLVSGPSKADVEPWLGRYVSGVETVAFEWDGGFVYHHGNIMIPVDGDWHVTVPEFHVRHRATWLAETRAVLLEESHDDSEPWRHELRLDDGASQLVKLSMTGGSDGGEVVVRTYDRLQP